MAPASTSSRRARPRLRRQDAAAASRADRAPAGADRHSSGQSCRAALRAVAVPGGEHAEHRGQILDDDLRAQFVDIEFGNQSDAKRARHVEEEAAAVLGRRLGDDEIGDDLALRRQQRAKRAVPGLRSRMSAVTSPCKKLRAPSPATLTTPRSGSRAAFMAKNFPNIARNVGYRPISLKARRYGRIFCALSKQKRDLTDLTL